MSKNNLDKDDHDLLIEVHVLLSNHLKHSDMLVKVALTAAVIGAVNFGIGLFFILLRFGLLT
jgi:hypothetical protein